MSRSGRSDLKRTESSASSNRTLFIGIDEAGYGPNLGPLVIGGSVFLGPARLAERDWWKSLSPRIARAGNPPAFAVDDSKAVLGRRDGWQRLSRTVRSCLESVGHSASDLSALLQRLAPDDVDSLHTEHWYDADDKCDPEVDAAQGRAACVESLTADCEAMAKALTCAGLELARLHASVVFPREFNRGLDAGNNKAEIEMLRIKELLARCLAHADGERVVVWVDRLGGRTYYRELVEDVAGDSFPVTVEEAPARSKYRFQMNGREVEITFAVRGDSLHLPIALASMLAKYLRERCMSGLNGFWRRRDPAVEPTAGYPGDASRFLDAISPVLAESGVALDALWRRR